MRLKSVRRKISRYIFKPILKNQTEILKNQTEILKNQTEILKNQTEIYSKFNILDCTIKDRIEAIDTHNEYRFYSIYKKDNEGFCDARKRFYKSIEPIDEYMKIKQRGNLYLLKEFSRICKDFNLNYTVAGGTLLGLIKHSGFIPWDDDVDVIMPYKDYIKFRKLIEELANNVNLEIIDWYLSFGSRKIPKLIFKNHKDTWYLDIFPVVECNIDDIEHAYNLYTKFQDETFLIVGEEFNRKQKEFIFNYEMTEENVDKINKIFDKQKEKYELQIFNNRKKCNCYVRSLEIPNDGAYVMALDDVYPLIEKEFCGIKVKVMNNWDKYLKANYGDYWKMPFDLNTHIHDKRNFNNDELKDMTIFLDKNIN